jgi:hypothetical protein
MAGPAVSQRRCTVKISQQDQQSEALLVIQRQRLERDVSRMASCGRLNMWRYSTPTYLDEEPDTKAILITIFPGQSQMYCVFSILLTNYTPCSGVGQFVGTMKGPKVYAQSREPRMQD